MKKPNLSIDPEDKPKFGKSITEESPISRFLPRFNEASTSKSM